MRNDPPRPVKVIIGIVALYGLWRLGVGIYFSVMRGNFHAMSIIIGIFLIALAAITWYQAHNRNGFI